MGKHQPRNIIFWTRTFSKRNIFQRKFFRPWFRSYYYVSLVQDLLSTRKFRDQIPVLLLQMIEHIEGLIYNSEMYATKYGKSV